MPFERLLKRRAEYCKYEWYVVLWQRACNAARKLQPIEAFLLGERFTEWWESVRRETDRFPSA